MLEPEIAALASDYATPEEKEELRQLCDEVEQIYRAGKNHAKKDVEFHTCIANAAETGWLHCCSRLSRQRLSRLSI